MDANTSDKLLTVRDLSVDFTAGGRTSLAVDRVTFDIVKGETLALVGESGSGKSVTALSVMQLLPYPTASHPSGSILFKGREMVGQPDSVMRQVRGDDITIIFQEPMTSAQSASHHREADRRDPGTASRHQGRKARARIIEV